MSQGKWHVIRVLHQPTTVCTRCCVPNKAIKNIFLQKTNLNRLCLERERLDYGLFG